MLQTYLGCCYCLLIATYINSNGPSGVDCTNDDHLQVVEQSNYARKKLDALEEKLNNKMQVSMCIIWKFIIIIIIIKM